MLEDVRRGVRGFVEAGMSAVSGALTPSRARDLARSMAKGEGIDKILQFLEGATVVKKKAPLMELPVLQDVPKCRAWAANVSNRSKYKPPIPPVWADRGPSRQEIATVWRRRLDFLLRHVIE